VIHTIGHRTTFDLYAKVIGKHRPRVTRGGQRTYTVKSDHLYMESIKAAYVSSGGLMHTSAVKVEITTYRSLPKSASKKLQATGEPDIHKPDVDNVAKVILDGLNGVAFTDDSQVTTLIVHKAWRTTGDEHVHVMVSDTSRVPDPRGDFIPEFRVYDLTTGENVTPEDVYESDGDWCGNLCYCDLDGFYIDQHGGLILADTCGNYASVPTYYDVEMNY